jgi:hypothetical protein
MWSRTEHRKVGNGSASFENAVQIYGANILASMSIPDQNRMKSSDIIARPYSVSSLSLQYTVFPKGERLLCADRPRDAASCSCQDSRIFVALLSCQTLQVRNIGGAGQHRPLLHAYSSDLWILTEALTAPEPPSHWQRNDTPRDRH